MFPPHYSERHLDRLRERADGTQLDSGDGGHLGHLIPGANVSFVDTLDVVATQDQQTSPPQSATPAQHPDTGSDPESLQVIEELGGGGWTRTNDLRIMRPSL